MLEEFQNGLVIYSREDRKIATNNIRQMKIRDVEMVIRYQKFSMVLYLRCRRSLTRGDLITAEQPRKLVPTLHIYEFIRRVDQYRTRRNCCQGMRRKCLKPRSVSRGFRRDEICTPEFRR